MAQIYNPATGEWEEQEEQQASPSLSQPMSTANTGNFNLSSLYTQPQVPTSTQFNFDGGDWVKQDAGGNITFKDAAGNWNPLGRGENAESWGYTGRAVDDPMVDKLFAYKAMNPNGLNNEQQAFFYNPIQGLDSFGQAYRWGNQLDLFDNRFDPQQAGALIQTGGNKFLSSADLQSGGAFNERESAAAQAARDDDGGFLGLGDLGTMLALAGAIYGGGTLAGLWGGSGAGAAGAISAADAAAGMGAIDAAGWGGMIEGAGGLDLLSAAGMGGADLAGWGGMIEGTAGLDIAPGLSNLFDASVINGLDLPAQAINALDSVPLDVAMNVNPMDYSYGMGNTETLGNTISQGAPTMYDGTIPETFDYGGYTGQDPSQGGFLNQAGEWVKNNKGLLNTGRNLYQIYNALQSEDRLKDTIGKMEGMYNSALNWNDPNRARGDFANQQWMTSFSNPRAAYDEFMGGAGQEFVNQARAQAAKSGRRGAYLNSGKMQSDLASLFMQKLPQYRDSIARGFSQGRDPASITAQFASPLAGLYQKQGGSLPMAIENILTRSLGTRQNVGSTVVDKMLSKLGF